MIKMIRGVFGLPVDGIIKGMDMNSGPFEASEEAEARLIRLGLAVRVEDETSDPVDTVYTDTPIGFDETPPVEEDGDTIPEYHEGMKASELREIGAMYGLSFKVGMNKKDMVAALDAYFNEEDTDDDEAPVFDPVEAVT